nr:hypothetical protein [Tanacetum cinerariifolium]
MDGTFLMACNFDVRSCSKLRKSHENFLKSLTAMAYSSSSLLEVEHSSSLSPLAFDYFRIFLDDHLVNFEIPDEFINYSTTLHKGVQHNISYTPKASTTASQTFGILGELGDVAFAFVGHNVIVEIHVDRGSEPWALIQVLERFAWEKITTSRMETEEVSKRYVAPCFMNGLEAYDREINLEQENFLILNEFVIKLCLEHEVKNEDKVVKKEFIFALRGEIYFVKFIINPEEDDLEPGVILGRSFMRLTKGIADIKNDVITIYPELDPFLDKTEETKKSEDDWELILDGIDFGDISDIDKAEILSFVCKIGKSARNKRRLFEKHQINYFDEGPSLNNRQPLTQEEASREAIAIDIYKRFSILEEARPVIETMTYSDKYKKILDSIFLDKQKLDVKSRKKKRKLQRGSQTDEPRNNYAKSLKGRTYGTLERRAMLVRVTTIIAKFLIFDVPVDKEVLILVGRGFLATYGSIDAIFLDHNCKIQI